MPLSCNTFSTVVLRLPWQILLRNDFNGETKQASKLDGLQELHCLFHLKAPAEAQLVSGFCFAVA